MKTRLALSAAGTLVAVGAGVGIGVAVTGTSVAATPSPSSSPSSSGTPSAGTQHAKHGRHADALGRLKNLEHAQWVTRDGSANVTHDAIHGSVTAVSATSLTVRAEDGTTQVYAIGSGTKVHLREAGNGSAKSGTIADVKTGDHVYAAGTQSGSTLAAKQVLDTGTK